MATDTQSRGRWNGGSASTASGTIVSTTSGALRELAVTWPRASEDAERQDEPRGADRGGARVVLRDGALARASPSRRDAADGAQDVGDRHVPAGRGHHAHRADGRGAGPRPRRRPASRDRASDAKENCPVSQALAAVPITLDAALAANLVRRMARSRQSRRGARALLPGGAGAACPTRPSTTTTARRRRSAGA